MSPSIARILLPILMSSSPDMPQTALRQDTPVAAHPGGQAATSAEDVKAALAAFLEAKQTDEVYERGKRLATFGEEAIRAVMHALRRGDLDQESTNDCLHWFVRHHPRHEQTVNVVLEYGIPLKDSWIQYESVCFLGDQKVYSAHRTLRRLLAAAESNDLIRAAAARSLAELGEPDVVRSLYTAAESDSFNVRLMAHHGFLALAGKSPNDFNGYSFVEGEAVTGGAVLSRQFEAIEDAERRAARFRALADFCGWLKAEKPELYKHLTYAR